MNQLRCACPLISAVGLFCLCALANRGSAAADGEFFESGAIPHLRITMPPEAISQLRTNARENVHAAVRDGTNLWSDVGIHLKGSIGSFRTIDGKPGLTMTFDKFVAAQRFHGLRKIYLNNSVEDPSHMNELIGNEMFRNAGVPAPRITHAVVELNGRPLGLYVLKEGFTEDFLARFFEHPDGNFYDLAPDGHDVNEAMEKDFGKGPPDRADLEALAAAALEPDLQRRQQRLAQTLDVQRFLAFMTMEILLGHRDGYCLARNNFRVYQDVDTGRLVFIPHGMDQLFGNPRATLYPTMNGLVARSFMEIPENRAVYRRHCALLRTNVLSTNRINQKMDAALRQLRAHLNADALAALERETTALKDRISSRMAQIDKQLHQNPLELLRFQNNIAALTDWQAVDVPEGGELTETTTRDGRNALMIRAGPVTSASWRTKVLLPRGRYRFEGRIKSEGVERLKFGKHHGAALKMPAVSTARTEPLLGTQIWKAVEAPFEINVREQEVELICELRAAKGTVWFDRDSLRLVRVE